MTATEYGNPATHADFVRWARAAYRPGERAQPNATAAGCAAPPAGAENPFCPVQEPELHAAWAEGNARARADRSARFAATIAPGLADRAGGNRQGVRR